MARQRALRRLFGPSYKDIMEKLAADDRAFYDRVGSAPEGSYFRVVSEAIRANPGRGAPVDFTRLTHELARLEQRVADLEDRP